MLEGHRESMEYFHLAIMQSVLKWSYVSGPVLLILGGWKYEGNVPFSVSWEEGSGALLSCFSNPLYRAN